MRPHADRWATVAAGCCSTNRSHDFAAVSSWTRVNMPETMRKVRTTPDAAPDPANRRDPPLQRPRERIGLPRFTLAMHTGTIECSLTPLAMHTGTRVFAHAVESRCSPTVRCQGVAASRGNVELL